MSKMKEEDLQRILKKPGYRVAPGAGIKALLDDVPRSMRKAVDKATTKAAEHIRKDVDAQVSRAILAATGNIEAMFEVQLLELKLWKAPQFQYKPLPNRRFRVDVAFVAGSCELFQPLAFEVQGNVHRIQHQFYRDMERHNLLTEAGWRIYYVSGNMVRDGSGAKLVCRILGS